MTASTILARPWRMLLAVAAALMLLASPALAMRVSPMVVEMESRGSGAVARIEVQNINPGKLAFQTRVFRMELGKDGEIIETPADDQFLIFPPQGALPAGGRQVIRLQWVGEAEPATSQAFYVSVEQLPVAFEPGSNEAVGAQVQVLYNMRALVVVAPPGAKPDVKAASVRQLDYQPPAPPGATELPPMQDGVEVTLRNDGRRHAMMSNFSWQLEGTDREGKWLRVDVSAEELNRAVGTGYVPAQGERSFKLPVPGFGPGPIKLTFKQ
ncbi:MAG: fimbria/pilus periplasmic chaperone [Sphingopyxis sp.]|uniref:fimbrial biogenesis chaperone n=1 Tax=Sphingopyxis sp. TaxID=1908224 RepID=UPI002ABA7F00|nr:fimbria/pilus periplasmic chaperone [Sphingopyxis sp.]MDZ3833348.1 fimbria/pilus periplasmic chaperone [Sphingopyxis sp.]